METWDASRARRNVRQFNEQPVPDEALDRILEAGRRAPSAGNWQPWDFVLVTNRARLLELAKVWQGAKHVAAADLGVGTGHVAAVDQGQARAPLGFPEGRFLADILAVGYPSDKPVAVIERLNRRPFEEVVHRGGW